MQKKVWAWPCARGAPKIWGFSFNIYTVAEASDLKFGTQLGFSKAHHQITPIANVGMQGLGLGELPEIPWFYCNICTISEATHFAFGTQLGFAKVNHKTTHRGQVGMVSG